MQKAIHSDDQRRRELEQDIGIDEDYRLIDDPRKPENFSAVLIQQFPAKTLKKQNKDKKSRPWKHSSGSCSSGMQQFHFSRNRKRKSCCDSALQNPKPATFTHTTYKYNTSRRRISQQNQKQNQPQSKCTRAPPQPQRSQLTCAEYGSSCIPSAT